MFLYLTLGTNDLKRSRSFYDAVLSTLGLACHYADDSEIGYGPAPAPETGRKCFLWVTKPYLGYPATWGNGTMVAFPAETRQAVRDFHAAAIANGGTDDGAPGLRPYHASFYSCYVRDPDGNKLSAVCEAASEG
jgi:catechol 2,3-dioxygenase-like lactoylglutathione lyase family enzyme